MFTQDSDRDVGRSGLILVRAMVSIERMPTLHRSILLAKLKSEFPDLHTHLNEWGGLLNLEVSAWAEFTQLAIHNEARDIVKTSFQIAHEFYIGGNRELQGAISVSFLEELDFGKHTWAWELLSRELKKELRVLIESGVAAPLAFDC